MDVRIIAEGVLAQAVFDRPTLVVSDLHENTGDKQDNFQQGLFGEFLLGFSPACYDLLDLGDRLDLWESPDVVGIVCHNRLVEIE